MIPMKDKADIVALIVSSERRFTEDALQGIASISETDPAYLLNLAKSLKGKEKTRLIAIRLLVETAIAISIKNSNVPMKERTLLPPLLANLVPEITTEIDDVLRAISYYIKKRGSMQYFPSSLKSGLRKTLEGIGKERVCQYPSNKKIGKISLNDALKMLHPRL